MQNRIYGILTIIAAFTIYLIAYRYYQKKNYKYCLYFILICGFLLRIYTSMDFYLHEWDERYHALVAKNIISNPLRPMLYTHPLLEYDYKDWARNHVWVHKQPFPLYTIALSMLIFGQNVIALRLPSILLSTISIFATFKIGKILASRKVGILAAFLFSINGLIIESTAGRVATDHIDVFFFSLVTLSVYFLLKSVDRKSSTFLTLGAILTGLAILSKWLPALIVIPVWLIYSYQKISGKYTLRSLLQFIITVAIVVLPWQFYITHTFPLEAAWEYEYNKKHIFEVLGPHGKPFHYHFDRMRIIFGEIIYLPLLWLIVTSYKKSLQREYSKLIVAIWILVPYLFFSIVSTKMQGYILFTAAAIFIMTAMFYFELKDFETKYNKLKQLILVLLLVLPIRYSIERIKPFSIRDRSPSWIRAMKEIDEQEKDNKAVVFNCKFPIETMFHTDLVAYEITPQLKELRSIKAQGIEVYIDNHLSIPKDLLDLKFVKYIEVTGNSK